ncbi:hypothetical protein THIOSC15_1450001 [uncultured Thiomicrorhabdus sp.]
MEGQVIARNIFLDGNSFVESRSVVKNPLVADAQLGLVFDWKEFRIGYTHVFRTKEFKSQRNHSNFGSLTIGVDF